MGAASEWKEALTEEACGVADFNLTVTFWGGIHERLKLFRRKAEGTLTLFLKGIRSVKSRGVRETILISKRELARRARKFRSFDRVNGTDTDGRIPLNELNIASGSQQHGEKYEASPPATFTKTIGSLALRYEDFIFIDVGSGKGRALLLASDYPFRKIIGVEFSSELHAIAVKNIAQYRSRRKRCSQIESLCIDAVEYEIPLTPAVYYFFNPFDDKILKIVLTKIKKSIDDCPRDAHFIYYNPKHAHVFEELGFPKERVLLVGVQAHDME